MRAGGRRCRRLGSMVTIRTIIMNAIDGERDMGEDSIMLEDFVILEVLVHSSKSSSTMNSMRLSTRHVLIRSVFTFSAGQ